MKRLFLLSLIFLSVFIYSEEYNVYNFITVKSFNHEELGFDISTEDGPNGPQLVYGNNTMIINDSRERRLAFLDKDFNIKEYVAKERSGLNFVYSRNNETLITSFIHHVLIIDRLTGEREFFVMVRDLPNINKPFDPFYFDDYLFLKTNGNELLALELSDDLPREVKNVLDETQIRNLILTLPELSDISIDSKNRIFLNGELQTRDYETFYRYWEEKNGSIEKVGNASEITTSTSINLHSGTSFVGRDNNGNVYWNDGMAILIFNNNGNLIDKFYLNPEMYFSCTPVVDPVGNIYFFKYRSDRIELNKISRQW